MSRLLLVAPQLGFSADGGTVPGGLLSFGRCVVRALACETRIRRLAVWSLVDRADVEPRIAALARECAHPDLEIHAVGYGGGRARLSAALFKSVAIGAFDRVMYLHINQAVLGLMPAHPRFVVWQIGREVLEPLSPMKIAALRRADTVLSISSYTTSAAASVNRGLPRGKVVHLCYEPGIEEAEPPRHGPDEPSVLIVGNIFRGMLYKGHQQLIAGWPLVVERCPDAELWIAGDGDGRSILEWQASLLPDRAKQRIRFLGRVDDHRLRDLYRRCRVFAMPSTGEGFGLTFVEAGRAGKPCIAGRFDAAREIIEHNVTGLLVEQHPYDVATACLDLLLDPERAAALGRRAKRKAETEFSFSAFRARLLGALPLAPA